jgi:hypothetical protein
VGATDDRERRLLPVPANYSPEFLAWYTAYPRHEAKRDAHKAWGQMGCAGIPLQTLLDALHWQIPLRGWDDPAKFLYIPLPATYLRGARWEDERPIPRDTPYRAIPGGPMIYPDLGDRRQN